ncbi:hypothetical protein [Rhizomonospora bruguierae]|uniref:hypothetical protein n=1 Tax=Rhizomonospora bruguierae TaxID=1581705 RepID=UPI001BCC02E7|nr:hypothetical protein [Micromonospora sp. NBRC 107566]
MRHHPRRPWWAPWRRHCACGLRSHPCPDSITVDAPPLRHSLGLAAARDPDPHGRNSRRLGSDGLNSHGLDTHRLDSDGLDPHDLGERSRAAHDRLADRPHSPAGD